MTFNQDVASTTAKVVDVTLQSPIINLDTFENCNLIDQRQAKKYIGTYSNEVANRRSKNDERCYCSTGLTTGTVFFTWYFDLAPLIKFSFKK